MAKNLLTELDDDLAKIIGMSSPFKESDITDGLSIWIRASKAIFLSIRNCFHKQAYGVKDDADNIATCAKAMLRILGDIRRVQDRYW